MRMRRALRKKTFVVLLLTIAAASGVLLIGSAGSASANGSVTYTAQETQPIPPAQNYAGTASGDGWALGFYNGRVYNVLHHATKLQLACHIQSTAASCPNAVETITDGSGNNFATSTGPGTYVDQATGKMWVYARRTVDETAGVVCIDLTISDTNPNPYCGFVPLSAIGDAATNAGRSLIGNPMMVGSRLYDFNFVANVGVVGTKNKILCFDTSTDTACAGQPYTVTIGVPGATLNSFVPEPYDAAIGTDLIFPLQVNGNNKLACFDTTTNTTCAGSWPVATPTVTVETYGAPFPMLDPTGSTVTGFCLPNGTDPCFSLTGASVATPAGMSAAIPQNVLTNGASVVIGPRVYVPNGNSNAVDCWDYSQAASCSGFPRAFSNLATLYTVNADPQRPACIWVNSDVGAFQIQNFDAYTGGPCTQNRVLASQFVVSGLPQCVPTTYTSFQIISPTPDVYGGGSVQFADGDGIPIPGLPTVPLDATGTADLTGLNLSTPTGLPQFLITLANGNISNVPLTTKLTWVAPFDPACGASKATTSLDANLNDGTTTAKSLTEWAGTPVTNQGILSGTNAATATGTVTYHWYTDNSCSTQATSDSVQTITTPGTLPASDPVNLPAGTYYETVDYSGDTANSASSTPCGLETLVVQQTPTNITYIGDTHVLVGASATIAFQLTDTDGNVLPGMPVTITLPGGSTFSGTTDANGVLSDVVTAPLTVGSYPVSESFAGQGPLGRYLASNGSGTLVTSDIPTNITYTGDTTVQAGQPATISFVLKDSSGNVLPHMPVSLTLPDGSPFSGTTDANGVVSTTITAPMHTGTLSTSESFGGQVPYESSTGPGTIQVTPIPTHITYLGDTTVQAGQPATVKYVLKDGSGNVLAGMPITVNLPFGGTATGTTDANGVFTTTQTAPMTTGSYGTTESFGGQDPYQSSTGPGTIQVTPIPTHIAYVGDTQVYSGQPVTVTFVLTNNVTSTPLAGMLVTINLPFGGTFTGTTDALGMVSDTITSPIVSSNTTYGTTETFAGQEPYLGSNGPGSILVKPIPTNITYTGDTSVTAGSTANVRFVLRNSITNNVLPNMPVTITLPGGGTVAGTTDANGVFSTTTGTLSAGSYSVSEAFGGKNQYLASTGPGTITVTAAPPPPLNCSAKGKTGAKCESILADPTVVSNSQLSIVATDDSSFAGACAPTAILMSNGQQLAVSTSPTSGQPQNYVNNYNGSLSAKYQELIKINLPSGLTSGQYSIRITACDGDGDMDQWTWNIAVDGSGNVTSVSTGPGPIDCTAKGTKCESILADPAVASNSQLTIVAMDDSPIGTSGATAPNAVLTSGQVLNVTTAATTGQPQNYVDSFKGSMSTKYQTLITINLPSLSAGNYTIRVTAYDGDGDLDQWNWPISVDGSGNVTTSASGGGSGGTLASGTTTCNGVYSGTGQSVTVPAGATCTLLPGTHVTGAVNVAKGGTLVASGVTIGANLAIQGSATVCASTIGNDLTATGAPGPGGGPIVIGGSSCAGNTVTHDLNVTGETGGVSVVSNQVGHDMNVKNDGPNTVVSDNTVGHDANCDKNAGQSGSGNSSSHNDSCPI